MDIKRLNEVVEKFLLSTSKIMGAKGNEYAYGDDKLINFKKTALAVGVNPETVAAVFLMKHMDSILSFVKKIQEGRTVTELELGLSEPIDGRLSDATNYLIFLVALIAERRTTEQGK
jgi:hypothetical protein